MHPYRSITLEMCQYRPEITKTAKSWVKGMFANPVWTTEYGGSKKTETNYLYGSERNIDGARNCAKWCMPARWRETGEHPQHSTVLEAPSNCLLFATLATCRRVTSGIIHNFSHQPKHFSNNHEEENGHGKYLNGSRRTVECLWDCTNSSFTSFGPDKS